MIKDVNKDQLSAKVIFNSKVFDFGILDLHISSSLSIHDRLMWLMNFKIDVRLVERRI